jgi:two-component system chemotaxis response regulator CheY
MTPPPALHVVGEVGGIADLKAQEETLFGHISEPEFPSGDTRPDGLPESAAMVDSPCLMIVEDDTMTRLIFEEALRDEGFDVLAAANGWEALRLLRGGIRPRLLFVDLVMPVMDGKTFIDHKAGDPKLCDIPVVILSAASDIEERCVALGAVTFLRKPVKLEVLIEIVEQFARKSRVPPSPSGVPD